MAKPEGVFLIGGPIILEELPSDKKQRRQKLHKLLNVYLSLNEYRRRKGDGQVRKAV